MFNTSVSVVLSVSNRNSIKFSPWLPYHQSHCTHLFHLPENVLYGVVVGILKDLFAKCMKGSKTKMLGDAIRNIFVGYWEIDFPFTSHIFGYSCLFRPLFNIQLSYKPFSFHISLSQNVTFSRDRLFMRSN